MEYRSARQFCETPCGVQSPIHSVNFFFNHSVERHSIRLQLGGVKFSIPRHFPAALYQAMEAKLKEDSAASSSCFFFFITAMFSTKL